MKPNPIILQTPIVWEGFDVGGGLVAARVMHMPQTGERCGRAAAPLEWLKTDGTVVRGVLVGSPDADVHDPSDPAYPDDVPVEDAGRVVFFRAPLDVQSNASANAWNEFVLLEPKDSVSEGNPGQPSAGLQQAQMSPQPSALFGAWIRSGKYTNAAAGQQFFVSARERLLIDSQQRPQAGAGQVYTFHVPSD